MMKVLWFIKDIKDGQMIGNIVLMFYHLLQIYNNDDEIIRVDKYYDKEINPNEYN